MILSLKDNKPLKKCLASFLIVASSFLQPIATFACNEDLTETYTTQLLFGDKASQYATAEEMKMLLDAVYLCGEQHDGLGREKHTNLTTKKVLFLPSFSELDIKEEDLSKCAHNSWDYECLENKKAQSNRKKVLQRTVNTVFDFGIINNIFGSSSGQCDDFSALLYYTHILSDYIAADPDETETTVKGQHISSYSGESSVEVNRNNPSFTPSQKQIKNSFFMFSPQDSLGRSGVAFANLSFENLAPTDSRQSIGFIKPTGWETVKYPGLVNSNPAYLYNRCHLIAHKLSNRDTEDNLITGTRYLNEAMIDFEKKVAQYIDRTKNHVLYRATPIYEGNNLLASGVQLEAYSIEDNGKGIKFNVYFYNVQPGVHINYATGQTECADTTIGDESIIPFAILSPSDSDPDLIYEISKVLSSLFSNQHNNPSYVTMMDQINETGNKARNVGNMNEDEATRYIKIKKYQYEFFDILKTYVPELLENEDFFNSAFGQTA